MTGPTLALVAVRLKSSRLPRKGLVDLAGRPLIVRLGERLGLARELDGQVWCTSTNPQDDPLEALAAEYGYACHRGSELDVLQRFLDVVEARGAETVIRVTGDNPLTDPAMMDHMIRAHREAGAEYTYTEDPDASEYMTLMLRRPDHFKVLPVAATDPAIRRPELRLTIDTPEDLEVVRAVYEAFAGQPPSLAEVIAWLDAHAELRDLNSAIRNGRRMGSTCVCGATRRPIRP